MTKLVKDNGFKDSECDLALTLQAKTILAPLLGSSTKEVKKKITANNALWLHIETILGLPCFVSFKAKVNSNDKANQNKISSAYCNDLMLGLKSINRIGAVLKDYGIWLPPKHLKYLSFEGRSLLCSDIVEVDICLPALSWEQHQVETSLYQTERLNTLLTVITIQLLGSYSENKFQAINYFILDTPINNQTKIFSLKINGFSELTFCVEENMKSDFDNMTINAEFALGEVTMSLSDYLSLEPGDTLRLPGVEVPLRGVLRVGGVVVSSGTLCLKEGELVVNLDKDSENISKLGNFLEKSSINEGEVEMGLLS